VRGGKREREEKGGEEDAWRVGDLMLMTQL
jgi:hypothetical protein